MGGTGGGMEATPKAGEEGTQRDSPRRATNDWSHTFSPTSLGSSTLYTKESLRRLLRDQEAHDLELPFVVRVAGIWENGVRQ